MPKLPDFTDLGNANIGESSRPSASVATDAIPQGINSLGAGLRSMGKDFSSIAAAKNKEAEAIGGSHGDAYMLQKDAENRQYLRDNPDQYDAWEKNSVANITKWTNEAAQLVPAGARAKWLAGQNERNQQRIAQYNTMANTHRKDAFVTQAGTSLEANEKIALDPNSTEEQRTEAIANSRAQIESLRERGFITSEQAKGWGDSWRQGYAKKFLLALTPEKRLEALGAIHSSNDVDAAKEILRRREGFITDARKDVNAPRLGYGTDTITNPDGTYRTVQYGDTVDKQGAERDLDRRTKIYLGQVKEAAGDGFSKLSVGARAAMTSVAYNYGKVPASVAAAAKTGDNEEVAKAIEGLSGHNNGINAERRRYEANIARGRSQGSGVASILPVEQQNIIRDGTIRELNQQDKQEVTEVTNLMRDDITGLQTTGAGIPEGSLNYERISKALGRDKADQWQMARARASKVFDATNGMETASIPELAARLEKLKPEPDVAPEVIPNPEDTAAPKLPTIRPGYTEDLQAYQSVLKRMQDMQKERESDPAKATEKSQSVIDAKKNFQYTEHPNGVKGPTPASIQNLIAARMKAQDEIGIPPESRAPLAKVEALEVARRLKAIPSDDEAGIKQFVLNLQHNYGDYSDEVLTQVIQQTGVSKIMAEAATEMLKKAATGFPATRAELDRFDAVANQSTLNDILAFKANERNQNDIQAGFASNPDKILPAGGAYMQKQMDKLKPKPEPEATRAIESSHVTALGNGSMEKRDFDNLYGAGMAEKILKERQRRMKRVPASGQ